LGPRYLAQRCGQLTAEGAECGEPVERIEADLLAEEAVESLRWAAQPTFGEDAAQRDLRVDLALGLRWTSQRRIAEAAEDLGISEPNRRSRRGSRKW
jgi:hypothetical protein